MTPNCRLLDEVRPIEQLAMMPFVLPRCMAEGDQSAPTGWTIGLRAWVRNRCGQRYQKPNR